MPAISFPMMRNRLSRHANSGSLIGWRFAIACACLFAICRTTNLTWVWISHYLGFWRLVQLLHAKPTTRYLYLVKVIRVIARFPWCASIPAFCKRSPTKRQLESDRFMALIWLADDPASIQNYTVLSHLAWHISTIRVNWTINTRHYIPDRASICGLFWQVDAG